MPPLVRDPGPYWACQPQRLRSPRDVCRRRLSSPAALCCGGLGARDVRPPSRRRVCLCLRAVLCLRRMGRRRSPRRCAFLALLGAR
eukprot:6096991-Pleurochrysis_carterae.AAC.1